MIIVEAKLISAIDASSETLCRMEIANLGTGTTARGNYKVKLYSRGKKPRLIKETTIYNWPRQAKPAWRLIQEAFKVMDPDD